MVKEDIYSLLSLALGCLMLWHRRRFAAEIDDKNRDLFFGRSSAGASKEVGWVIVLTGIGFIVSGIMGFMATRW